VKSTPAIQARESESYCFEEIRLAKRQAIIESLESGASVTDACNAAGIDRRTFYNWIKADREFELAISEAKLSRIESMQAIAYLCAKKSLMDPRYQTSLIAWMNNEGGWGKSANVSTQSQSNVHVYIPNNQRDVTKMSDAELENELYSFLSLLDKRTVLQHLGIPVSELPESVVKLLG
jgi:transposase-like protein